MLSELLHPMTANESAAVTMVAARPRVKVDPKVRNMSPPEKDAVQETANEAVTAELGNGPKKCCRKILRKSFDEGWCENRTDFGKEFEKFRR
jgi:hypothetical protein